MAEPERRQTSINNIKEEYEGETRNGVEIIKECAKDICYFVDLLNKGKLEATKKKYSTDALYNVASLMFISK